MHRAIVVQAFIPNTQGGRGRQMFVLRGQPGLQSESQPSQSMQRNPIMKKPKNKNNRSPPTAKKKNKT